MKKRRNRSDSSAWMAFPLYIFTIVFVVCPLIYMVALSFATPSRGFGVTWKFTLDNYRNILEPVYLNTCLLYTSPSPRDATLSRMPSSA